MSISVTQHGGVAPAYGHGAIRRTARIAVPIVFVVALVVSSALTLPWFKLGQPLYSHQYPGTPGLPAGLVAGAAVASIPPSNDILQLTITDLTTLAQALPPQAISVIGTTDHLLEPVLVSNGGHLVINGGTLVLDQGSYIEVGPGGTVRLTGVTVRATGDPTTRGFLAAVGGLMVLRHDRLAGLGRFASLARGVTFEGAQRGSGVYDTVIQGAAVGVFSLNSAGLVIAGNRIDASRADGIQIQGRAVAPVISGNVVTNSAGDGIAISSGATHATILDNRLSSTVRYGILVNATSGRLVVQGNTVSSAFDGIVCDNTTGTLLRGNTVDAAQRFGIRLSGVTSRIMVSANVLTRNAVGVYASHGPHGNFILNNHFDGNGENVRLRVSAPGNVVSPSPGHSELRSP